MHGISYGGMKMKTNKCYKCQAENTLQSKECWNCGADISNKGHLKNMFWSAIVMGVLYYLFVYGAK